MDDSTRVVKVLGRRSIAGAIKRQPLAAIGVALLAVFVVCAVFAPWLAPQDPARLDLTGRLVGPSGSHWFGTDELGRDILSRVLYGARISLVVAVSVVALSGAIGLIAGMLAGFYGGWPDTVINVYVMNAFLALPGILLAIAFVAFMGAGAGECDRGAGNLGVGWICAAGAGAGAGGEGTRVRRGCAGARGFGFTRYLATYFAEHRAAADRAGCDWDGGRGAGGGDAELSGAGDSGACRELGIDAERCAVASVRLAAPGVFPAMAVMLCVLSFNFIGDALRDYLDPRMRLRAGL